ncbi:MAG TPA: exodeoxyribonuclease VII large subunit, partial [Stenomitos sp.]
IAVVTSPQAAAWGDIKRTLKSRYPGLQILLSPSLVQGDQAAESIAAAIARVEADGRAEVLILARGGGASEDLACFNDERVVRAIAQCRIPVIAGIGHQRDETLADLVADCFAHTPTAAASLAVPCLEDLQVLHRKRYTKLLNALESTVLESQGVLQQQRARLHGLQLDRKLKQEAGALASDRRRLIQTMRYRLRSHQQRHQFLQQKLASLDPREVLRRGYAIARAEDGSIVRQADGLVSDQILRLQLGEGAVRVRIID